MSHHRERSDLINHLVDFVEAERTVDFAVHVDENR